MANWNKKPVKSSDIQPLCEKYSINQILASILVRRGVTSGQDILYYLEEDLRFQHSPFAFNSMEDAVERILQAKEEGEKVLIFGDDDVDGITSTAILYEELVRLGLDVKWRLPLEDDPYGLSMQAVDDFAKEAGTLIITVDCGISNFEEIKHANDLGIDVIVTDHHNPPDELPQAIIILDQKTQDSGYPFHDISGAAVAYKLVSALRFSQSDFYNAEICLFDINFDSEKELYKVDCLKIRNLVKIKELHEEIIPGKTSIYDLKLPYFLQGQLIYVWDSLESKKLLAEIFGSGVEFNLYDLKKEVSKIMPGLKNKNTQELQKMSQIAKYIKEESSLINSLYNLYVSYCKKIQISKKPELNDIEKKDLQLVALAALADIMPMKNENRIFVKNGINSIKKDRPRPGLAELFHKLNIKIDSITSTDLSWTVIPALNAAGRMGKSNLALELLISKDANEREKLANTIYDLNEERKELVGKALFTIQDSAKQSLELYNNKLCISIDESINKGVTGIVAARLMQDLKVPAMAVTYSDNICIGSMRTCRGFIATTFLDSFGDFFINHGGHDCAAGFSFEKSKLSIFLKKVEELSNTIELEEESSDIDVDAELPTSHINPEVFKLLDQFEPYGAENKELIFMTKDFKLCDAMVVGKKEPLHLKLIFDTGKFKIPAMYWGQGERLKKDINLGQSYDILYTMSKNHFNGISTNQIIIKDLLPSQN
ncbi:MAG: single-stranded-DNA-specific exonuclease RecJ [Treponema sp.]|nr:single-stranded-DNA-specific exonuclease RecJ [Treponema sp.]